MTDISKDLLAIRPVHAGVKEVEEKMQYVCRREETHKLKRRGKKEELEMKTVVLKSYLMGLFIMTSNRLLPE